MPYRLGMSRHGAPVRSTHRMPLTIYVDCIIRRWQAYAKDDAILAPSGETFDEVAKKRREENARISLTPEHEIGDSQIVDHSDAPRKRHAYPRKTSPPAVQRPGDIDTGYPTESIVVGGVRVGRQLPKR